MSAFKYRNELLITIVASLLFIPFLGATHLFDWDEINFAESSREMLLTGNYSIPQIAFEPYWEKPPLFFWMQVVCMKAFGINEFAARLPNAICGIITLLVLYKIGSRLIDEKFGLVWVLVFAGSLLPHLYFKSGIIDPWFNLFIFLAIYHLFNYSNHTSHRLVKYILLAGLFTGLAVMTKGPVAMLIVGLCYGVYSISNSFKKFMSFSHIILFLVVSAAVGGIWFLALYFNDQQQIISQFLAYQLRLFKTEDAGHGGPFYYHFIVLLIGCFPAAALAIAGMQQFKQIHTSKYFFKWMLILFWIVLVLFSIVKTKIVHYSSLCYFPLTFLAATALYNFSKQSLQPGGWLKWLQIFTGILLSMVILLAGSINYLKPLLLSPGLIQDEFAKANLQANVVWSGFEIFPGLLLLAGVIGYAFFAEKYIARSLILLLIITTLSFNLLIVLITPKVEPYSQGAAIEFYENHAGENAIMQPYGFFSYAHLFYGKRSAEFSRHAVDSIITQRSQPSVPVYFVAKINYENEIAGLHPEYKKLYAKNGFIFYKLIR